MDQRLLYGFLLYATAQTLAWFQLNSQFVWKYWEDRPFTAAIVFSIPVSLCFWFGTKNIYAASQQLWSARFIGFTSGIFIFSILTWLFLNESMFSLKTMLCLTLSCVILAIQIFMK